MDKPSSQITNSGILKNTTPKGIADMCKHRFYEEPAANFSSEPLEIKCAFCGYYPYREDAE